MNKTNKGFSLAELLIVIAIIAVLAAIAIAVFTTQLEKSREAADASDIRSQYAEVMTEAITTGNDVNSDGSNRVMLKQTQDEWQSNIFPESFNNLGTVIGSPSKGGNAWVEYKQDGSVVTIHFEGGSGGESGGVGGESGGVGGSSFVTAGTEYPVKPNGKVLKLGKNDSVLLINSPSNDPITITIYIHNGNNLNSNVSGTTTVTLQPGVNTIDISSKTNNRTVGISFGNSSLTLEQLDQLINSISAQ